jgi:hypothetical protein
MTEDPEIPEDGLEENSGEASAEEERSQDELPFRRIPAQLALHGPPTCPLQKVLDADVSARIIPAADVC